ncbi:metal-dependent hydrolase [Desulfobaculum bizertense]|uniref:LexA-binding, inner membrane-associated putative hydrolase n=1 Tax=Desulfobaculum bizertense DSM 18034 TaxID=1121442 RepID=A0A1T4VNJ9_9BACT|nr:metal-dependent hydrolase [Desulfobaculum bizertense]UIJ38142.1 metal-dependent hydrolase [Desulfobaculum bizertense]SKA66543.1 LexA-binding, inner membrane-associated putative hydrolase [Desulfobaculum bizertense DSM 18034]
MPGYKEHLTGGAATAGGSLLIACLALPVALKPNLPEGLALFSICVLMSLFPDVDTDSKGQRWFYSILVVVDLALMWFGKYHWAAILGLVAMFPALDHHRGWTHTWWAMLLVPLPIILFPVFFLAMDWQPMVPYYVAAVLGYFSHLFLDKAF